MEVHHHPHLHESKKFKEYFLEFIMIFLAVSLGFIAENLREHLTDRSKEKEYIVGFIRNLQDDTANMRHVINFYDRQVKGIDSMLHLSHASMKIDSNRKSFYYFALQYFYNSSSFKSNDATLQQLKSTGDYRLIEKDHVADSLSAYDEAVTHGYSQADYYNAYFRELLSMLDELMDITIYTDTSFIKNGRMTNKSYPAMPADTLKLRTFFNKVFDFRIITSSYRDNYLKPGLEDATRLRGYLRKEYDIKD
jgi:hypothetical protein